MNKFKFIAKDEIKKFPKNNGVYCFKNKREILYIGKAANIRERVKNHFQQPIFKDNFLLDKIRKIGYIQTNSEIEALILEANLIKKYQPRFNVLWRDDKNYFYVGITKEEFPRIFITHQKKLEIGNWSAPSVPLSGISLARPEKLEINYIGPFVDGTALKQTLKIFRKIFPYRSCNRIPSRPCLFYQLERCPAPCLLKAKLAEQIPGLERKLINECQKNAKNIIKILKGQKNQALKDLKKEMKTASKSRNFERAAKIRDQITAFEKILRHSPIFSPSEINVISLLWQVYYVDWRETEKKLKKILSTKKVISRIEAYDISNIQGKQATGSMVVFTKGKPEKSSYRKFKIKNASKPNDVAMIKEILNRRFNHPEWPYPDLILIDGGKAQLNGALNIISHHNLAKSASICVLALAKKENKLYIEGKNGPVSLKQLPRQIFNLILQLSDEAHRFAKSYHYKLRKIDFYSKS